jgi:hypothetical protein
MNSPLCFSSIRLDLKRPLWCDGSWEERGKRGGVSIYGFLAQVQLPPFRKGGLGGFAFFCER